VNAGPVVDRKLGAVRVDAEVPVLHQRDTSVGERAAAHLGIDDAVAIDPKRSVIVAKAPFREGRNLVAS
jgi:hypothetical protein